MEVGNIILLGNISKYTVDIRKLLYIYFSMSFANRIGEFGVLFFLWFCIDSAKVIGVLILLDSIVSISSGLIYAKISRLMEKSKIVKLSYVMRITTYTCFFIFFSSGSSAYWILGLIMIIHSLSDAFLDPIIYSTVSQIAKKEEYIGVNSIISLIDNISLFISPLLGSLLISINSGGNSYLFIVVLLVLCIGLINILKWKNFIPHQYDSLNRNVFLKNMIDLFKNKTILFLMGAFLIFNFTMIPLLNILYPAIIVHEKNLSATTLAFYEVTFSLGLIILSVSQIFAKTGVNKSKFFIVFSFLLCSIGMLLIGLSPDLIIGAIGSLVIGCSLSLLRIHNNSFFQSTIPIEKQSDFFAIRGVILNSVSPFSIAGISMAIAILGPQFVIVIISIILFILGLLLFISFKINID